MFYILNNVSMKAIVAVILLSCFVVESAFAQGKSGLDSTRYVDEVVVVAKNKQSVIPSQVLGGKELRRLNSLSVADALRFFSGVQLKDYGGVGGIKTINIRSMGTNHVGIYYDGIELGNAQNGQVDLGQFSLDNVDEISLYNGQKSQIFQPAADFGNAGSVYIRTRRPKFAIGKDYNLRAKAKYGSSGLLSLSALYEQKLSQSLSGSLSIGELTSSGKYKFRYKRQNFDGTTAYDTTATRENGDVKAIRVEANLFGLFSQGNWSVKAYTYHSERGIPGAIVNNVWRRGERQWDYNSFVQALAQKTIGNFDTQLKVKYAYYDTHYVNNDTTQMLIDNTYKQQELYLSSANMLAITRWWSVSLSYDFKWNKLDADLLGFAYPHRFQNMIATATSINLKRFDLMGSLLLTTAKDHVKYGSAQAATSKLTPAIFASYRPFANDRLTLRAFAKKSFRMPTFNDLFYTDIGNSNLKPETAIQYDLGATYNQSFSGKLLKGISLQADGYYNTIGNKIVAYPKGQQFRWTMVNLGKVHITGLDVSAGATFEPTSELIVALKAQYTWQRAIDVTNPSDSYYRDQIPYVPRHSGSAMVGVTYRRWSLNYSFIYAGERYSQKENILYNYVQPWYTSDMNISYRSSLGKANWRLTLEVNNLFSQDYDVIVNYPMPKRNYGISLEIE